MKIWYDACTGKHIRYGTAVAQHLRKLGHEVVFTTREHPDTLSLASILGEKPIVVGKYNPQSLFSRVEESSNRIIGFCKMFRNNLPDIAVSNQSVELCRTAFGLRIPIVLTADTPHASAVNRLTLPFADTLVVSSCIPKRFFRRHCAGNIVQFDGVDEVAWIRGFKSSRVAESGKPLIVVRQMETKAAYAENKIDYTMEAARKLDSLGKVLFIGRYNEAGREFKAKEDFVDSVSAVANADLVVTVGGTLSREAALLGVPSIVISKMGYHVNSYLAKRGFPLFLTSPQKLIITAKKYIGRRYDVESKLAQLENPVDKIEMTIREAHRYPKS